MGEKLAQKIDTVKNKLLLYKNKLLQRPVLAALHDIAIGYHEQRVTGLAAESAYYIVLAFFPFIIFLVSILGLIGRRSDMAERLLNEVNGLIPEPLLGVIGSFLFETLESSNLTLVSFSMIGVILASSNGFTVLLRGLDRTYDERQKYSVIILRGMGLLFTFFIGLGILLTLLLIAFGGLLIEQLQVWTGHGIFRGSLLQWLRFLISFTLLFFVFELLYAFVANKRKRLLQALPGALFSTLGWIGLSVGFSWYINNFDRYARLYGSITGLILLMVWIYFCCNVLLLGGIINSVIHQRRQARRRHKLEQAELQSQN